MISYGICLSLYELFHSGWESLVPSMLLQVALCHSFLWLSSSPLYIYTLHLPNPIICWWTFELFQILAVVNRADLQAVRLLAGQFCILVVGWNWSPSVYFHISLPSMKTFFKKDTCTCMFIAALFTIAKTWKQPKCPSTDDWIRNSAFLSITDWKRQRNFVVPLIKL